MIVSLVAAMGENRVIGRGDALPWHLPEDLRRFRELTWGHTVIMGRTTYLSIGRPLPNRRMLVLSRSPSFRPSGVESFPGIDAALAACAGEEEVFVCGGAEVYRAALPRADRIYLTVIHREYEGDVRFPPVPEAFVEVEREEVGGEPPATLLVLERRRAEEPATRGGTTGRAGSGDSP